MFPKKPIKLVTKAGGKLHGASREMAASCRLTFLGPYVTTALQRKSADLEEKDLEETAEEERWNQ